MQNWDVFRCVQWRVKGLGSPLKRTGSRDRAESGRYGSSFLCPRRDLLWSSYEAVCVVSQLLTPCDGNFLYPETFCLFVSTNFSPLRSTSLPPEKDTSVLLELLAVVGREARPRDLTPDCRENIWDDVGREKR